MKLNLKRPLHIVLVILIIAALTFIFVQSSLSNEKSVEHSQKVEAAIDKITGSKDNGESKNDEEQTSNQDKESVEKPQNPTTDSSADAPKKIPLRKLAHFIEHGILGMLVLLLAISMESEASEIKRKIPLHTIRALFVINIGVWVALLDETIQIFSGRGASVKDIWLDISGSLSFIAVTYLIALVVYAVRYNCEVRKSVAEILKL